MVKDGGQRVCIMSWTSLSPLQELLSHSTDRPERQQLKEALEAMQVGKLRQGRVQASVGLHIPSLRALTGT